MRKAFSYKKPHTLRSGGMRRGFAGAELLQQESSEPSNGCTLMDPVGAAEVFQPA